MSGNESFDDDVINVVPYVLHIVPDRNRYKAIKSVFDNHLMHTDIRSMYFSIWAHVQDSQRKQILRSI